MSMVGVAKQIFSIAPVSQCFINIEELTGYLLNITFIFDRCCCSIAAATPDKYERNPKGQTYRKVSNISRTKSQNLNASRVIF